VKYGQSKKAATTITKMVINQKTDLLINDYLTHILLGQYFSLA
jgi:hypothetical protein